MRRMNSSEIKAAMERVPDWRRKRQSLARTFQFKDFAAALRFVNAVARCAEKAGHHPDIDIRWNVVSLGLTTHDAKGVTEKDFALAEQVDRLIK